MNFIQRYLIQHLQQKYHLPDNLKQKILPGILAKCKWVRELENDFPKRAQLLLN